MNEELERFFASYAEALTTGDAHTIASFYAAPGIVVADQATIPLAKIEDVEKAFAGAAERFRSQGIHEARPTITVVAPLSEKLSLAHVTWSYLAEDESIVNVEHEGYLIRAMPEGGFTIVVVIVLPRGEAAELTH